MHAYFSLFIPCLLSMVEINLKFHLLAGAGNLNSTPRFFYLFYIFSYTIPFFTVFPIYPQHILLNGFTNFVCYLKFILSADHTAFLYISHLLIVSFFMYNHYLSHFFALSSINLNWDLWNKIEPIPPYKGLNWEYVLMYVYFFF